MKTCTVLEGRNNEKQDIPLTWEHITSVISKSHSASHYNDILETDRGVSPKMGFKNNNNNKSDLEGSLG